MAKKRCPRLAQKRARMKDRRLRIMKDLRKANPTTTELSARYGVSTKTILKDLRALAEELDDEIAKAIRHSKELQIERYMEAARQADETYERSKQDEETIRTEYAKIECPLCNGKGIGKRGKACQGCDGEGHLLEEKEVRTVKGQAGDTSALKTKVSALDSVSKVLGHFVQPRKEESPAQAPGTIVYNVDLRRQQIANVSTEEILRRKDEAERAMLAGPVIIEGEEARDPEREGSEDE